MLSTQGFVPLPAIDGGWNFEVQGMTDPYRMWVEQLVEVGHSKFLDTDQGLPLLVNALSHGLLTHTRFLWLRLFRQPRETTGH